MFHGEGTIYVPDCGSYKAFWNEGKEVRGDYTFNDGLEYEKKVVCSINNQRLKYLHLVWQCYFYCRPPEAVNNRAM